jgi:nucleotide-binding universal stress UspA family protein
MASVRGALPAYTQVRAVAEGTTVAQGVAAMFKHILVPVDADEGSRLAIAQAVELARTLGARITGLHVLTEFVHFGIVDELLEPPAAEVARLKHATAGRLLEPLVNAASHAGVPCDTVAESGERPWELIVRTATSAECDLIVMASHGRSGFARLLLGSQTRQVLNHTGVSVLVVR